MKKTRRRALYIVAALLAAVFVLACIAGFAACGGGSDDCDTNGHTWDTGVETTAATCTTDGVTTYTCTVCGETKTEPIAALGHDLTTTTVDATCTEAGSVTETCSRGDYTNTTTIDALGHTVVGTYDSTTQQWTYACSECTETIDLTNDAEAIASVTLQPADEASLTAAVALGGNVVLAQSITVSTMTSGATAAFTVSADTEIDLAGSTLSTAESLSSALNTIEVSANATLTIIDSTGSGAIKNTYTGVTSTDNAAAIAVAEGGTLVIESGAIESTSIGVKAEGITSGSDGRATVTIDGGEISSTYFSIWAAGDADVTINGGTVTGTDKGIYIGGDASFGYNGYQTNTKTTLTITGGTVSSTNESAICTLGTANSSSAEITISGGTITSSAQIVYDDDNVTVKTAAPTIYLPNGTLTVTGGTIISENLTAVEVRGGTVTISGGELIGGATLQGDDASSEKSGAKTYGYALSVYPYQHTNRSNLDNKVNVTVTDGTFTGDIYVAATAEKASDGEELWKVVLNGEDSAKQNASYVVTIQSDAINATITAYDANGKIEEANIETSTPTYYIVTVTAVAAVSA